MINNGYILYLDDDEHRNPETTIQSPAREIVDSLRGKFPLAQLIWVKTSEAFKAQIELELPLAVSLDHDIGELMENAPETTGFDCAKALCEKCFNEEVPLPEFHCHSNNTPGRENILGEFKFYIKHHPWMEPKKHAI